MSDSKVRNLMPDDIEWIKEGMERLEQSFKDGMDRLEQQFTIANVRLNEKLDGLPCLSHMTELTGVKQQVKTHLEGHKEGWAKSAVLITACSVLIALVSMILLVIFKGK